MATPSAAARRLAYLYNLANHPKTKDAERTAARQAAARVLASHPELAEQAQVSTPDGSTRIPMRPDGTPVFFGKNYVEGRDIAVIAKLIRIQVKQMRKAARLHPAEEGGLAIPDPIGEAPKDMKITAHIGRFSGGGSIDMPLDNIPEDWWETYTDMGDTMRRPTARFRALIDACKALLDSYNRDGSDTASDYWDVAFYSSVHYRGLILA